MAIQPNFLIVGAAKAGTTALYHHLRQHPQVFMPTEAKEPMFLAGIRADHYDGPGQVYARGKVQTWDEYLALFDQAAGHDAVGEASVPYLFYHERTIPQIERRLGRSTRIIISLRHPVARAYSNYLHHVRDGVEPLDFEAALAAEAARREAHWWWGYQYAAGSRYADAVQAYIDTFGRERVHVVLYNDLVRDPRAVMRGLFRFLGVDPDVEVDVSGRHNVSSVPRSRVLERWLGAGGPLKAGLRTLMPQAARRTMRQWLKRWNHVQPPALDAALATRLARDYQRDISRLESVLGRDLAAWRN